MVSSLVPSFHIPSIVANIPYCAEANYVCVTTLLNSNADNQSTLVRHSIPNNKTPCWHVMTNFNNDISAILVPGIFTLM